MKRFIILPILFICASCSKVECIEARCPVNQGCCGIDLNDSRAGKEGDGLGGAIYNEYFCGTQDQCSTGKWGAVPLKEGECNAIAVKQDWQLGDSYCPSNTRKGKSFSIGT